MSKNSYKLSRNNLEDITLKLHRKRVCGIEIKLLEEKRFAVKPVIRLSNWLFCMQGILSNL